MEPPDLYIIDNVVGRQLSIEMVKVSAFYGKAFNFQRFWSVDDRRPPNNQYSGHRSIVMSDYDGYERFLPLSFSFVFIK